MKWPTIHPRWLRIPDESVHPFRTISYTRREEAAEGPRMRLGGRSTSSSKPMDDVLGTDSRPSGPRQPDPRRAPTLGPTAVRKPPSAGFA